MGSSNCRNSYDTQKVFDQACGIHNHIASIEDDMIDNKRVLNEPK